MSKSYILSRMDWAKAYRDYEFLKVGGENLYIFETRDVGKRLESDGSIINIGTYQVSDFIPVNKGLYTVTRFEDDFTRVGFYDRDKNFIVREVLKKEDNQFTVKDGVGYVKLSVLRDEKIKLEKGIRTPYTPNPSDINAQPYPAQVAHDMYQATEGNWVKAEQDYELLKVGKTNLLPEMGEQIRSNMQPINHSNVVGFYTGTILTEPKVYGKMYLFPKIPIDSTKSFRLKATFSNAETNISVVYAYDKNGELILDKEVFDKSVKVEKSKFDSNYKGAIYVDAPPSLNILVEILSDDIKYIAVALGSNHIDKMTQPLTVSNWKIERGDASTPFTPSPESINASPFTVKLANDYYNQQSEITELRNAILQLGGQ